MQIRLYPSPNHGPRRAPRGIDMLVLHYTGMASAEAALARMCDPAAAVSAHYLVEEDGALWRLVAEERRAWHAGAASWGGVTDVNSRSIGIELQNPGHEHSYREFPAAQIAALTRLAGDIVARHRIPPARVLGHSDVAPRRKQDPGEKFPWEALAGAGFGLWPDFDHATAEPADARRDLAAIGYEIADDLAAAITAFQRHWRPARCDGALDGETARRIAIRAACAASI
jgi:N-acetylmuramoyl-L-alanine amidase